MYSGESKLKAGNSAAGYRISARAAADLADIYAYSLENWGEARADRYLEAIYAGFAKIIALPADNARQARAFPFRLAAAEQHFIIYDHLPDGIYILTVQHQARDIESLINAFSADFLGEIAAIRRDLT